MPTLTIPGSVVKEVVLPKIVSSTLILRRAPVETPDELQEAEFRHGGPSDFEFSAQNPKDTSDGMNIRTNPRDDEEEEPPPPDLLMTFEEFDYLSETIVITAEGDEDVSITEERKTQSDYLAPAEFVNMVSKATGVKYDQVVLRLKFFWKDQAE